MKKRTANQFFKEFTHNAIVHPLMMFLPSKIGRFIHNANAEWAFKERDLANKSDK